MTHAPWTSNFFQFHAVFGDNLTKSCVGATLEGWRPISWKSWICLCMMDHFHHGVIVRFGSISPVIYYLMLNDPEIGTVQGLESHQTGKQ